ncbi:tetratricopeptide repeat protein [Massilia sp. YIM B04103]|uniref:tetratricopeptide repeat protein n=1 Tax=Massilia sp. YIM B04103 TaxID=2963106 RepID=UPI00210E8E4C|nr:tetratricopeptide repeat protein [Massilia sp. YIM B04103]
MQSEQQSAAAERLVRIESYLAADAQNKELLAEAIDLSLAAGALARAAEHAAAALACYPDDAFFQARQGHVLLAQQQWEAAAALFGALLERHADVNLAYNFAYAAQMLGRYAEVVAALAPFAAGATLRAPTAAVLLRAWHHLGEYDAALELIARQEADGAVDAGFYGVAGAIFFDADQIEDAARCSQAALADAKAPLEALVVGGSLALAKADGSAAASQLFEQALARNPAEGRAWSGLGLASLLRQDLATAQEQLEKAVQYLPGHIGSWHVLGWCKIFRQDLAGAEAVFRHALELDRNFGDSHGGLGVVQALLGQKAEAEGSIERALRLDPQSLSARYAQMVLAGDTSDPVRFRALAQRLLAGRPAPLGGTMADLLPPAKER